MRIRLPMTRQGQARLRDAQQRAHTAEVAQLRAERRASDYAAEATSLRAQLADHHRSRGQFESLLQQAVYAGRSAGMSL